ncbi:MAG: ATP-binding protein [Mesorhizobium sp.]|uniref:ATP-binding protein n=1 Tax=Mesorhizobium sp. TaxID=1871066 RepID=UPI001223700B|nr:ATP-binding protein [Mesorhizobium sp.]TIO76174.1 MAG: ATP-binding protein [Mesorhizobium sp.]TIO83128.1 MAG: ATP-binding protein [Mesorhizobium sp.]
MRLCKLVLENFRCYAAETRIEFDDFTALVGRNDVGKSAVLDAMEIFFGGRAADKGDVSNTADGNPIRITCEFDLLPTSIVIDADFETSLAAEHILRTNGNLAIRKTYANATGKLVSVEALANHPSAENAGDLLLLKRAELIVRANALGVQVPAGNANAPLRAAIWGNFANLNLAERHINLDKEGAKQIWSSIENLLPTYALFRSDRVSSDQDPEAQDPLKAAIREAISQVADQLAQIQARVEAEVQKIADATVAKVKEMDPSIAETLQPVVTTKKWDSLFSTNITGDENVPINKRGSGVRRLILLSFFRARAEQVAENREVGHVIYAVEEPETSQHPRNQRMLLAALTELAALGRQVIVSTHTPMLARGLPEESLRLIERNNDNTRTISPGGAGGAISQRIAESLGVLADHNIKAFIGVEGQHDIAFLKAASRAFLAAGVDVPDLDALELAGEILFFPMGGSNLALWASRLSPLNRPEFHICDRDTQPPAMAKYQAHVNAVNARPGCQAVNTARREMENYVHPDAISEGYADNHIAIVLPPNFAPFDDVPTLVAQAVHAATSPNPWPADDETQRRKVSRAKHQINGAAMAKMTAQRFGQVDPNNEVRGWLLTIGQMLG